MSGLRRRLGRLERERPRPSPWDAMDPILAGLSTPELVALLRHGSNVAHGLRPTPEQEAVYATVRDRMASVGIALL